VTIAIYLLRADGKDAPHLDVAQQLFMYRFLRNKMNGAQGEAPSKFWEEDRHIVIGKDFISEVGFPIST
jgi:hypothetical protein